VTGFETTLRKLAVRDDRFIESVLALDADNVAASGLDPKAHALVTVGALVAMNAAPPSFMSAVESAHVAGVTDEEIVGTLIALMPVVGVTRVVSAAPNLGLALGYDVVAALESNSDAITS
jgi:4-carboxymuconolactone decarboxylase